MTSAWLTSFILGCILAKLGATTAGHLLASTVFTMLALACAYTLRRRVFVAIAGLVWGLAHAAPAPRGAPSEVVVLAASGAPHGRSTVLVAAADGVFEAYGPAQPGVAGRLRVAPRVGLFTTHGARVEARFSPPPSGAQPLWLRLSGSLRSELLEGASRFPWFDRQWLRGVVAGDRAAFDPRVEEAFRRTGMFHLLVVSGQHVTLVAVILGALLAAPLRVLYALTIIPPRHWPACSAALAIVLSLIGFLYAAATGLSVASQRAAMTFAVLKILHAFATWLPLKQRLILAGAAQSLVFPVGFLGEANLMSWGATLLVMAGTNESALRVQVKLTLLAAALFGQLTLLAVPGNLAFVPVFSVLLTAGFTLCLWPTAPFAPLVLAMQRTFADLVVRFGSLCDHAPWLAPPPESLPGWVRGAFVVVSATLLLNVAPKLSIRPLDQGPMDRGNA